MPCVQFYFPSSCFSQSSIPVYFPQLLPIPIIPQCILSPVNPFVLCQCICYPFLCCFLVDWFSCFFVVFPRLLDLVPSLNFVFRGLLFSYPLKGKL